jgi:hypothetical protein
MDKLARALLLAGALILALLVGVLIGRSQRAQPTAGNTQAVQITTAPPPAVAPTPLPAPVETPKAADVPKPSQDEQMQEDAAAVGMTTRAPEDQTATAPPAPSPAPAPQTDETEGNAE